MPKTDKAFSLKDHNADRMRRADSWFKQSNNTTSDDEKFIFLWIAFNAAYGADLTATETDYGESKKFKDFLKAIVELDKKQAIQTILWKTFSGPIRILLKNPYVFEPFWESVRGMSECENWNERFKRNNAGAQRALAAGNVPGLLAEVFMRLYTLRNQIFHGGVTFSKGWGQDQIRDGSRIMANLVPVILKIMRADIEKNPDSPVWGKVAYPRVNESPQ